jgi:hypothetical protein
MGRWFFSWLFGRVDRPDLRAARIVDVADGARHLELLVRKVSAMNELGGFDTSFTDHDGNWARQLEIMVETKRRLDSLELRVELLEKWGA